MAKKEWSTFLKDLGPKHQNQMQFRITNGTLVWGRVLHVGREAVGVVYSASRLGKNFIGEFRGYTNKNRCWESLHIEFKLLDFWVLQKISVFIGFDISLVSRALEYTNRISAEG